MRSGEAFVRRGRALAAAFTLAFALAGVGDARAATFTVNSTGDEGDSSAEDSICFTGSGFFTCTLRAAIEEANRDPGADLIHFDIPGGGVQKIKPQTSLPQVTEPVEIDGYTQPGAAPNTTESLGAPLDTKIMVEVMGSSIFFAAGSGSSKISGLAIGKSPDTGIVGGPGATPVVRGCFVGTDASGTRARPNTAAGVAALGTAGTVVGGPEPEHRNLISGNLGSGLGSNGGADVSYNYIGTAKDGETPLPNGSNGVGSFGENFIFRNVIAFNDDDGINAPNGANTFLRQNLVFRNGGTAIDLGPDGPTPNDPLDADPFRQNHPVIKSAKRKGTSTVVKIELHSTPNTEYAIDYFSGKRKKADAERLLGLSSEVVTDANGDWSDKVTLIPKVRRGHRITATATDVEAGADGATSELAKPQMVK